MNRWILYLFVLLVVIGVYIEINNLKKVQNAPTNSQINDKKVLGLRTKSVNCAVNGALPDSACTPGAADKNLTKDLICSSSFSTKSIRNVPVSEKNEVYSEYGILSHRPGQYEVDHLISLELGGSNEIANLWPEAAEPRPGFHEKDKVENYLHKQVCNGFISLEEAQYIIATNWLEIFKTLPGN